MMTSEPHSASLRPLITKFLGEDHFGAGVEMVEAVAQHALTMEVDFSTIGRFQESVPCLGKNSDDSSVG